MSDQIASPMATPPASVGTGMAPGAVYSGSWLAQLGCRSRKWHGTVLAAQAYQHGETGLRWKLAASNDALLAAASAGHSDQRRRAGHFLIDSVRKPCGQAAWLWLGRPFGGGTGINLALVHAGERTPATPFPDAFAFWRATGGWWLAYQHGRRYQRAMQGHSSQVAACSAGSVLSRHRQGQAFIADG